MILIFSRADIELALNQIESERNALLPGVKRILGDEAVTNYWKVQDSGMRLLLRKIGFLTEEDE